MKVTREEEVYGGDDLRRGRDGYDAVTKKRHSDFGGSCLKLG